MEKSTVLVDENDMILIDKPAGISSFGVVARVRRKLSERAGTVRVKGKDGVIREKRKKVKVGHTGTLDPFATGLLILLKGKGTKHANEFLKLDKEYVATVKLGEISSTGDIEGEKTVIVDPDLSTDALLTVRRSVLENSKDDGGAVYEMDVPTFEKVSEAVKKFTGEIEQRVPNYSAVKINGQRAYKLAREGKQVEMPVRKVMIYELEILEYKWPELTIRCKVSSGTYIRALGEDIGKVLGVGGYLTALRRTQVGQYRVENAQILEDFEEVEK